MKLDYKAPRGEAKAWASRSFSSMERAATKAMRETAKNVQVRARAEIQRGIGARNARSFFARAKPRSGYSLKTSMRGYLRIGYLNIFERGGTIKPKSARYLWVPLPNAPQKIARKRITPKLYIAQIGPLQFVHPAGKKPLLMGQVTGRATGKLTAGRLKTGSRNRLARRAGGKGRRTVSVPIFVGLSTATIKDRLNVDRVYREARANLPKVYAEQMLAEARR